jgi:SAM-dependent methyltransferase
VERGATGGLRLRPRSPGRDRTRPPSLIYRSPVVYELLMRALYARHYAARMAAVADEVPPGASVLECCCGPATLYRRHLRTRAQGYVGLDVSPRFVSVLRRAGVDARLVDLAEDPAPLPGADVAIIQASLYHFLPDAGQLIDRMLEAAGDRVIVAEPVRNLSDSRLSPLARLARRATDPGVGGHGQRFDEASLDRLMESYSARVLRAFTIPGGREKVYVLRAG